MRRKLPKHGGYKDKEEIHPTPNSNWSWIALVWMGYY